MARTHNKWVRPYVDGYDFSGEARKVGACGLTYDATADSAMGDAIKNTVLGQPDISVGPINAFFSPLAVASGFHDHFSAPPADRNVMIAVGVQAEPVMGNPVFAWTLEQDSYQMDTGEYFVTCMLGLKPRSTGIVNYSNPWGVLLHAKSAETAVDSATGLDDFGVGPPSFGGLFSYQLFTSNGTVTLKAQDAATNADGSFADLTGATSGSIDASTTPKSGMVALTATAAVRRYLRWQLVFGTATTATFAMAFARRTFAL